MDFQTKFDEILNSNEKANKAVKLFLEAQEKVNGKEFVHEIIKESKQNKKFRTAIQFKAISEVAWLELDFGG